MSQICLFCEVLRSGLSRSGITRLLCLKVWFGNGFNRIDLPRLQTLDFGANAFRDCIQVQFESVAWELK